MLFFQEGQLIILSKHVENKMKKALIALDIDGTLAPPRAPVPLQVAEYLHHLQKEGHLIVVMTGRSFTFASKLLNWIKGPFYLAVQNGAAIVELPARRVVYRKYIPKEMISDLDAILLQVQSKDLEGDYLIEGGIEQEDRCFFRKNKHSQAQLSYLELRQKISNEDWIDVGSFQEIQFEEFPMIKYFGEKLIVESLADQIATQTGLHVPIVHDPFKDKGYIALGTHPEISKGVALQKLKEIIDPSLFIIAAGDDLNDEDMIEAADYGIVMETAPVQLKAKADFIAPSAEKQGIIKGLIEAFKHNR